MTSKLMFTICIKNTHISKLVWNKAYINPDIIILGIRTYFAAAIFLTLQILMLGLISYVYESASHLKSLK